MQQPVEVQVDEHEPIVERVSAIDRGPNSGNVGKGWLKTKASAIAVAGTPSSDPSCSARRRRSKLSSL